jgi:anthranilate phosphoribosyltransferase
VGVASPALIALYRDAMTLLGTEAAMIVSGAEGLDELSIAGPSYVATVGLPGIGTEISPDSMGLMPHPLDALRGGEADFNAAALSGLLMGAPGAYRDAVLLNSAAALIVADEVDDWYAGVEEATEAIDKGLAKALLDCWIETVK